MAKKTIMVRDRIFAHKVEEFLEIMNTWIVPGVRSQIPGFEARHYSTVVGDILEVIVMAEIDQEHVFDYDRWIVDALVRAHGQEAVDEYLARFYECLDSSVYSVLVEW